MKIQIRLILRVIAYALIFFQIVALDAKINGREYAQKWDVTLIPTYLLTPLGLLYFALFGKDIASYYSSVKKRWYFSPYLWALLSLSWFFSLAFAQVYFAMQYLNAADDNHKTTLNLVPIYLFIPTLSAAMELRRYIKVKSITQAFKPMTAMEKRTLTSDQDDVEEQVDDILS